MHFTEIIVLMRVCLVAKTTCYLRCVRPFVLLPVLMCQRGSRWKDFPKILYWRTYMKLCRGEINSVKIVQKYRAIYAEI
jgi:hypothetical protein